MRGIIFLVMNSLSYIVAGHNPYPMPCWLLVACAMFLFVAWVCDYLKKARDLDREYDPDDPPEFPDPSDDSNQDPEDWD